MQDRPNQQELIEAVAQFLTEEILPLTAENPRLKFRTLIAANVLSIVVRELNESEPLLRAEWQRLARLFGQAQTEVPDHPFQLRQSIEDYNRELCSQIRAGRADSGEWSERLVAHLQATVYEKLQIANPRFLERELADKAQ